MGRFNKGGPPTEAFARGRPRRGTLVGCATAAGRGAQSEVGAKKEPAAVNRNCFIGPRRRKLNPPTYRPAAAHYFRIVTITRLQLYALGKFEPHDARRRRPLQGRRRRDPPKKGDYDDKQLEKQPDGKSILQVFSFYRGVICADDECLLVASAVSLLLES
ncbi:hypothetical protein EVAR_16276_1 [Eumeta japonica]|uniref:Uncharacterized protein n=1 Tax=Eumeta variegata TaxID=151549 RepID=A0A4C1U5V4_EUMVA|nr:hypothetical protein EVAR_16276_1 [Eumeta japonica]